MRELSAIYDHFMRVCTDENEEVQKVIREFPHKYTFFYIRTNFIRTKRLKMTQNLRTS